MTSGGGVPLLVDLTGVSVLVVGAGATAAAKLDTLLEAGAEVTVVAPHADEQVGEAAAAGRVRWEQRLYEEADLDGAVLVVAATGAPGVDDRVIGEATARGILAVPSGGSVGPRQGATAVFMGSVRRGPLVLAVSTSGTSPALARAVRADLEERYGTEWGELAALLGALRTDPRVREALAGLQPSHRAARWRAVLATDILNLLRAGRHQRAKEVALECLFSSSA